MYELISTDSCWYNMAGLFTQLDMKSENLFLNEAVDMA